MFVDIDKIQNPNEISQPWDIAISEKNRPYTKLVELSLENAFYQCKITSENGVETTLPVFTWGPNKVLCALSPFSIGQYEITYGLWYEVLTWAFQHGYYFTTRGKGLGNEGFKPTQEDFNVPVNGLDWYNAAIWCNAYSEMCGLTPCYYFEDGTICKDASLKQYDEDTKCLLNLLDYGTWNTKANGFRLPTLAEWECAAGGGFNEKKYTYPGTDDFSKIEEYAWLYNNSNLKYHKVGEKKPNTLNLYDMCGNISEWVYNFYRGSNVYNGCNSAKKTVIINNKEQTIYCNPIGLTIVDMKTNYNSMSKHFCGASINYGNDSSSNLQERTDRLEASCESIFQLAAAPYINFYGLRVVKNGGIN